MTEPPVAPSLPRKLLRLPFLLLATLALIAAVGVHTLGALRGAEAAYADQQLVRLLFGAVLLLSAALLPPCLWLRASYPLYAVALLLVLLVPLLGSVPSGAGARRWLVLGGVSLQPAEFLKLALILALARYFHDLPPQRLAHPLALLPPALLILLPLVPVVLQPDLGTALLVAAIGTGVLFVAGVNVLYFLAAGGLLLAALPEVWRRLHDYQRERILTFLDPERDPLGAGYHLLQSKIAIGSAGVWGKGHGQGTQSQLDFLPEKHTDFIFAMFAEEHGLAGAFLLLALYALAFLLLVAMAVKTREPFGRLTIAGMAMAFGVYVFINVGMAIGLLPVVGVPLPLFSYGGTSILTLTVGFGIATGAFVHRGWPASWQCRPPPLSGPSTRRWRGRDGLL